MTHLPLDISPALAKRDTPLPLALFRDTGRLSFAWALSRKLFCMSTRAPELFIDIG
jgi:hypothetical protein